MYIFLYLIEIDIHFNGGGGQGGLDFSSSLTIFFKASFIMCMCVGGGKQFMKRTL